MRENYKWIDLNHQRANTVSEIINLQRQVLQSGICDPRQRKYCDKNGFIIRSCGSSCLRIRRKTAQRWPKTMPA